MTGTVLTSEVAVLDFCRHLLCNSCVVNFKLLPNETKPAFAVSALSGAPFNSGGDDCDHIQDGALFNAAVRLASTNSFQEKKSRHVEQRPNISNCAYYLYI